MVSQHLQMLDQFRKRAERDSEYRKGLVSGLFSLDPPLEAGSFSVQEGYEDGLAFRESQLFVENRFFKEVRGELECIEEQLNRFQGVRGQFRRLN